MTFFELNHAELTNARGASSLPAPATTFDGDAANSHALSRARVLRLAVLPQALRVIVPPLTAQYLTRTRNPSAAVAIRCRDIMSIANASAADVAQIHFTTIVPTICGCNEQKYG